MSKVAFLFLCCAAAICTIGVKLFFIQILASDRYLSQNYLQTKKIQPRRGQIFDRHKNPLVINKTTYFLYAEPQEIEDKKLALAKLEEILKMDRATLEAKLSSDKQWIPLIAGLDKESKDKVMAFKLNGIGFEEEERRFYPEGSSAAHLLGFLGKDERGDNVGYFGIEGYYEKDLIGLPGILKTERDLLGQPIFVGVQDKIKAQDGRNLILTIDKSVQSIVKEKLSQGLSKYGAKEGCVIVADPQKLEIIALVCLPDFDPRQYSSFSEAYFRNPAIATLYEPGSIFKPLIMAAAINEDILQPDDTYQEVGPISIGQYEIKTWNNQYEGTITMTRMLEKSSNVGLVYVGEKLGAKRLLVYLKQYGIGQATGIDLQGESAGFLKKTADWRVIDYATAAFGQGIAVTQIQTLRAFAALINGGYLMQPHVVSAALAEDATELVKEKKLRRVIDEATSKKIKKMLESTVVNGDAKWARPKGYRIGGKTGTAQIPVAGRYDPEKTVASFVGFAPVAKPQFIVLVTLREPSSSPWGSETAAPLFFNLARELFVYYNIAPDQ